MKRFFLFFAIFLCQSLFCFGKISLHSEKTPKKALAIILDKQDQMILEQRSPSTLQKINEGKKLSIYDVIQLSQSGVNDDTIISYMNESKSQYQLNQTQIYRMQNSGVSQRVINYMIDTGY